MRQDKIQSSLGRGRPQQLKQAVARSGQGKGLRPGASIYNKGSPPARPPVPVKPNAGGGATPAESANPISPAERTNATPDPTNSQQDSALSQGIMNWARSMQRIDPSLAESPALRKAIRELSRHIGENDPRWDKLGQNASA